MSLEIDYEKCQTALRISHTLSLMLWLIRLERRHRGLCRDMNNTLSSLVVTVNTELYLYALVVVDVYQTKETSNLESV